MRYVNKILISLILPVSVYFGLEAGNDPCDCSIKSRQILERSHSLPSKGKDSVEYEDRIHCLQRMLPQYSAETILDLMVDRRGESEESNMTSLGVHKVIQEDQAYLITLSGLKEIDSDSPIDLEQRLDVEVSTPAYLEIDAIWDKNPTESGDGNNILGENGLFLLESSVINVPVVEATDESLAYYGGKLVYPGDIVKFPDEGFPIWLMNLGKNYIKDFVMTQKGGGMYLEYHCDRPHFHMPLSEDADGYLLLAKKVSVVDQEIQKFRYHLTAFKIPFGKGIYTYKGTIHADPALIGTSWMVGYDNAEHYSTVMVREKETNEKVTINFIK